MLNRVRRVADRIRSFSKRETGCRYSEMRAAVLVDRGRQHIEIAEETLLGLKLADLSGFRHTILDFAVLPAPDSFLHNSKSIRKLWYAS